jgi:Replication-relaxation
MGKLDALGRATFHHIAEQSAVRVTNRELFWLVHINRHGPQPSTALIELTASTHRCRDTSLRALQRLRAGGILSLPRQQRQIERAEFNPYIYDVTELGRAHLLNHDRLESSVRPTGQWWHAYGVGALTAAIERAGAEKGIEYIPPHSILGRAKCDLPLLTPLGPVIPDQLFALDYSGSYRAFLLEHDRGTEPIASKAARESLDRKLSRYAAAVATDLHRQHYGLKSPLALLFTFTSRARAAHFLDLLSAKYPRLMASVVITVLNSDDPLLLQAKAYAEAPWQRASGGTFGILAP